MEPIIYELPQINKAAKLNESTIKFDKYPNPKLIKYGFNNISDKINMSGVTSDPHYRDGLRIDFNRTDANGISQLGKKKFGANKFTQTFAEFWELFNLFGLLNSNQTILTNQLDPVKEIIDSYQKMAKSKLKITATDKTSTASLVVQKYSDMDIDENASFQFILNDLPKLMAVQSKGSSMVLQIFSIQTEIMAELIYYLSSLYDYAYLAKPVVTSFLSDAKYLVLVGLREPTKVSIPKHPNDVYIQSLVAGNLPKKLEDTIRCMNSELFPRQILLYLKIKSYVTAKIYDGETNKEMQESQNKNAKEWIEVYSNMGKMKDLMENASKQSKNMCDKYEEWEQKL